MEQDFLSTLECELSPPTREGEGDRGSKIFYQPYLVGWLTVSSCEGGKEGGWQGETERETVEGCRQRVFCQPPSVCLLLRNCSMNVTNHRKRKQ